jgi:ABC-type spermidine/putrescine transport system permease subunit I
MIAKRVALACVVGIILPLALVGWTVAMTELFLDSSLCGEYTGCFGYLMKAWEVGRWVAVVVAWPLLWYAFLLALVSGLIAYPVAVLIVGRLGRSGERAA